MVKLKKMNEHCIVFCACPNQSVAEIIAHKLVEQRLAACVNLIPAMQSVYRWENKVVVDNEILLIIQSTTACFDELAKVILSLHPYNIPEIISSPIQQGTVPYLHWLTDNCKNI
jgi:periplasmic divalent cation tolerance protein